MTTEELRALIAKTERGLDQVLTAKDMAELARDALRFRWLEDNAGYYVWGDDCRIEWRGDGPSIGAAIDADMGKAP